MKNRRTNDKTIHPAVFNRLFAQGIVHFFAGFFDRTFGIDGIADFLDGLVDSFTGFLSRPLFLAGHGRKDEREQA